MTDDTGRVLFCLLDGESDVFRINVSTAKMVIDLKQSVRSEAHGALRDYDAYRLRLYKLNRPIPLNPAKDLCQKIKNEGEIETFAELLEEVNHSVGRVFSEQPPTDNLHLIVKLPPDEDQRPPERVRLSGPVSVQDRQVDEEHANWREFWKALWNKGLEHFESQYIETRTIKLGDRMGEFSVMKTHKAFRLHLKALLIRDEWRIAWKCASEAAQKGAYKSFILVGQPGIGKSLSLYYFLSMRLAQGLPTLFQSDLTFVWFFNKDGVHVFEAGLHWQAIPGISEEKVALWALVDSNRHVTDPAPIVSDHGAPTFVIQASSPRRDCWKWTKYHNGSSWHFYLKPFSLEELLEGNELQETPAKEADIHEFYIKYGPSAHRCYSACAVPEVGMFRYKARLEMAIEEMTFRSIERLLNSATVIPQLDTDPYLVVLLEPTDNDRGKPKVQVIRRTVIQLLWQKHGDLLKYKGKELFCVLSQNPASSTITRWLFEGQIHVQLEAGIDVPLNSVNSNAVDDGHVASNICLGRWKSRPMVYVPFTQNNCELKVEPLHYYVPVDPINPTYDSFAFDGISMTGCNGPIINPGNGEVLTSTNMSSIGIFTVFRATNVFEYDVDEAGLNHILALANNAGLKAAAIRYAVVIPAQHQVTIKVPVGWRDKLAMFSLPITL